MRAPAIVVPLALAALLGSCILPGAVLDGSSAGPSSGSTTTGGTGGLIVTPFEIGERSDVNAMAPSGNPGQRHLFFAGGMWWLLHLVSLDGQHGVLFRGSYDFHTWATQTALQGLQGIDMLAFEFDPGVADGRMFGVDVQRQQDGTDVVHLSASSGSASAPLKAHARATVQQHRLVFDAPAVQLPSGTPASGLDATVTAIDPHYLHVFDFFSYVLPQCGSCALRFTYPDSMPGWDSEVGSSPVSLDTPTTPAAVSLRAALALGGNTAVLWHDAAGVQYAHHGPYKVEAWSTNLLVSDELGAGARNFAACVQPSGGGHVIHWSPEMGFRHFITSDGQKWVERSAPDDLGDTGSGLFLACGLTHVHAFMLDPTGGSFTIHGATLDGETWGPWSPVIDTKSEFGRRCFLTGYDRVVPGQGVGLLWSESGDCTTPQSPHLYGALVPAED